MPIKESVVPGAKDAKKARNRSLGLEQGDITFILNAIKHAMIPGSDLQQAVITVAKLQDIFSQFNRAKEKQKDIDATFFLPPALINKF